MKCMVAALIVLAVFVLYGQMLESFAQSDQKQAEAPAAIIAAIVADIPKGTKVTVNPEALVIDEAKKVWLNKHVPVGGETGVTVLHMENGSYEVEITDGKLRWLKTPMDEDLKKSLIPVQKITMNVSKENGQLKPAEPKKN